MEYMTDKHDGGKGDTPRPLSVSMEEFDKNFDAIFGKKEKSNVTIDIEADTDGQQVTITKTWDIG